MRKCGNAEDVRSARNNARNIPRTTLISRLEAAEREEIKPTVKSPNLEVALAEQKMVYDLQIRELKKQFSSKQMKTLRARGNETLDDETLKVPLLIIDNKIKPKICNDLVTGVDIFPTILSYLGIKTNYSNIDGRDLTPLINGSKLKEIPIFIQSGDKQEQKDSLVVGIRTSKFKYYRSRKNPKENIHLYNLENDPFEKNNLVNSFPEIINSMEKTLLQYEMIQQITTIEENDDENKKIEAELKKLGYI